MSNPWLRWHTGTCEDGKFRMIARIASLALPGNGGNGKVTVGNAIALWALLLEDASHEDHRGICTRGEDFYGAILDLEFDEVAQILSAMEQVKMISVGHGEITICNWNKRQFETDSKDPTNTERQRRFKEKRKQNTNQTQGNGKVTAQKHQIQNTDTDKNKEKNTKKEIFVLPEWVNHQLWIDFMEVRKAKKAADTLRAKNSIINELDRFRQKGHDPNEIIEKSIRNSWKDVFEPKENNNGKPAKSSFRSEGQRLADKYREDAKREEQSAVNRNPDTGLCVAESIRQDG